MVVPLTPVAWNILLVEESGCRSTTGEVPNGRFLEIWTMRAEMLRARFYLRSPSVGWRGQLIVRDAPHGRRLHRHSTCTGRRHFYEAWTGKLNLVL